MPPRSFAHHPAQTRTSAYHPTPTRSLARHPTETRSFTWHRTQTRTSARHPTQTLTFDQHGQLAEAIIDRRVRAQQQGVGQRRVVVDAHVHFEPRARVYALDNLSARGISLRMSHPTRKRERYMALTSQTSGIGAEHKESPSRRYRSVHQREGRGSTQITNRGTPRSVQQKRTGMRAFGIATTWM